jgi:hypothetical protein
MAIFLRQGLAVGPLSKNLLEEKMEVNSPSPSPSPIVVLLMKSVLKENNMTDVETVGYKHEYLIHVFHNRIELVVSC